MHQKQDGNIPQDDLPLRKKKYYHEIFRIQKNKNSLIISKRIKTVFMYCNLILSRRGRVWTNG
jgi:hypothetical protein